MTLILNDDLKNRILEKFLLKDLVNLKM